MAYTIRMLPFQIYQLHVNRVIAPGQYTLLLLSVHPQQTSPPHCKVLARPSIQTMQLLTFEWRLSSRHERRY